MAAEDSFKILVRKAGEEASEIAVTAATTIAEIKSQKGLKGYVCCYKGNRKDAETMAALGMKPGDTISVCKTAQTAVYQATRKLQRGKAKGGTAKSTAHAHLHTQTQAVVVEAVMTEGQRNHEQMQNNHKEVMSAVTQAPASRTFPCDHAVVRTKLERGGLTSTQLLRLHRAANLSPPMRKNAAGKDVPEKAKYQLAQSLCSAAGPGEHVVQSAPSGSNVEEAPQIFDYPTLASWVEAISHQRPEAEWVPPAHAALLAPPAPKQRRSKRKAVETAATELPHAETTGDAGGAGLTGIPSTPQPDGGGSQVAPNAKRVKRGRAQAMPNQTLLEFFGEPSAVVEQGIEQASHGSPCAQAHPALGELYFDTVPIGEAAEKACAEPALTHASTEASGGSSPASTTLTEASSGHLSSESLAADSGREVQPHIANTIAPAPSQTEAAEAADAQPGEGTDEPMAEDVHNNAPRPPKASVIDPKLRHIDAVEVFDAKGAFSHWAPLTLEGLCGHPCSDGKLCNNNAGDCRAHQRSELARMAREDEQTTLVERGPCGVLGRGGACEKPRGRCGVHTEAWHLEREQRAMQTEDAASCLADRGQCGVIPRTGGEPCGKPKGRCHIHAEEGVRCESSFDSDPRERCWNRKAEGSCFCSQHQDYPNYSKTVAKWAAEQSQKNGPPDEESFRAFLRAAYPDAPYEQPPAHDFQKFVKTFASFPSEA